MVPSPETASARLKIDDGEPPRPRNVDCANVLDCAPDPTKTKANSPTWPESDQDRLMADCSQIAERHNRRDSRRISMAERVGIDHLQRKDSPPGSVPHFPALPNGFCALSDLQARPAPHPAAARKQPPPPRPASRAHQRQPQPIDPICRDHNGHPLRPRARGVVITLRKSDARARLRGRPVVCPLHPPRNQYRHSSSTGARLSRSSSIIAQHSAMTGRTHFPGRLPGSGSGHRSRRSSTAASNLRTSAARTSSGASSSQPRRIAVRNSRRSPR